MVFVALDIVVVAVVLLFHLPVAGCRDKRKGNMKKRAREGQKTVVRD